MLVKAVSDDFCRNTADNRIRRNIFGDDRTGADNCAVADCQSVHNHGVFADPDIVSNCDRFAVFFNIIFEHWFVFVWKQWACRNSGYRVAADADGAVLSD